MLKLVKAPDPILKEWCSYVEDDEFHDVVKLTPNMRNIMKENSGCGLAAPQVGISKRFFMIGPEMLINPQIVKYSHEAISVEEGCLSLPGCVLQVLRPSSVFVEYIDYKKELKSMTLHGDCARIFQHEYDHLNGITIDHYLNTWVTSNKVQNAHVAHRDRA